MELDRDVCIRALRTRDARFDGRFFIGVRTTGIFCRPICPARPKVENCDFYPSAAAALEAGLRPCLRCRPEASPGTPAWIGTSATVSRALRLIADGALDHGSVGELAERLGIGARHLRRLFDRHLGASPVSVAQIRRILFAKRLIDESALSMSEIALASGFRSQRRFNEALRDTYGMSASELRRRAAKRQRRTPLVAEAVEAAPIEVQLPYRAPLEWSALLSYFAVRATPGVEHVDLSADGGCGCYRRTIDIAAGASAGGARAAGWVEVFDRPEDESLCARFSIPQGSELLSAVERLRRVFDLGADPLAIAELLGRDPLLRRSVRARPGLRVPGAWDGFELAVRAVLGQQVSVKGATTLAARLVERFGDEPSTLASAPAGLRRLFPTPEQLAEADIASIGMPRARAGAIRALALAVVEGRVDLGGATELERSLHALRSLPGIGEWTAQYVALRALREPDAFPSGDLALRRALAGRIATAAAPQAKAKRTKRAAASRKPAEASVLPSARELEAISERWRPWRAYASLHLWSADPGAPAGSRNAA